MKINIATFNIQHGKNYPHFLKTGEEVIDLDSCIAQIAETKADICGINEVNNDEPAGGVNQAKYIGEGLSFNYYFARAIDKAPGHEYGNALVSRFPIKSINTYCIETTKEERIGKLGYENRVLVHAVIEVGDKELSVYVCHIGLAPIEQERAGKLIVEKVTQDSNPLVLMGDFNLTPDSDIIKSFGSVLTDTAQLIKGNRLTFPSDVPFKTIDYIFVNDKVKALTAEVVEKSCADHREYIAQIEI